MTDSSASLWSSLPHTWTRDLRDPLFTFVLGNGEEWGFYGMEVMAWNELLALVALQAFAYASLSTIVYSMVIKRQGTVLSYLMSYGMIIPLIFVLPFKGFAVLSVKNQIFRFCVSAIMPVTCLFKTTAAVHGFTPDYAKTSLKGFALYYTTPLLMERDPKLDKYVPSTLSDNLGHLKLFIVMVFIIGFMQSLFFYVPWLVPPMSQGQIPPDSDYYKLSTLLYPQKWLLRNLIFGLYFQLKISSFGAGLMLAQSLLTGKKILAIMDNPMLTARTLSQFWGGKWNIVIHDALKKGVYLPVRRHFPKHVAMMATFVSSGIFHEVLLWMYTYPLDDSNGCFSEENAALTKVDCYRPPLFTTTCFFIWQALGIALEFSPLGQLKIWTKLPTPICTLIVVVGGCPLAHFFCEPYWSSLGFENSRMMFFMFKPIGA